MSEIPLSKVCTKCGAEKVLEEFGKNSQLLDGKQRFCKDCTNQKQSACRAVRKEGRLCCFPVNKKACVSCGEVKTAKDYSLVRKSRDGLSGLCKDCDSIKGREYYANNKEKVNARNNANYAKDPQRVMDRQREFLSANPETKKLKNERRIERYNEDKDRALSRGREYYRENKEKVDAKNKRWREENRDRATAIVVAYQMRKANLFVEFVDYDVLYGRDKSCYLCGERLPSSVSRHVDHITPLSRKELNPTHEYANCAGTHQPCNLSKFDRTPEEYWQSYAISWPLTTRDNWINHETPWYCPRPPVGQ